MPEASPAPLPRRVLAVTSAAAFVTPFLVAAANLAVPSVAREFSADAAQAGWIATAFLLPSAALLVPAGRAGDLFGRARVFRAGLAALCLASFACAAAPTLGALFAARAAQGAASALIFGTGLAILTLATPPSARGRALGWNVAATYVGLSAGPALGGLLIDRFGWRAIFLAVALALPAVLLLARCALPPDAPAGGRFPAGSALLYSAGVALLLAGLARPDRFGAAAALAGLLLLARYARAERAAASPLLPFALFRENRVFALSTLAAAIHYSASFAVGFLVSLHLQRVAGLSARDAGLLLVCQPVVMALLSPAAGRLSDRLEPRVPATAGMLITAAGLLLLARLSPESSPGAVAGLLALLGFGYALFSSPNMSAIMGSVAARHAGVAAGVTGTARLAGQAASMSFATAAFALALPAIPLEAATPAQLVATMRPLFLVFALLAFGGAACSAARGDVRPPRAPSGG